MQRSEELDKELSLQERDRHSRCQSTPSLATSMGVMGWIQKFLSRRIFSWKGPMPDLWGSSSTHRVPQHSGQHTSGCQSGSLWERGRRTVPLLASSSTHTHLSLGLVPCFFDGLKLYTVLGSKRQKMGIHAHTSNAYTQGAANSFENHKNLSKQVKECSWRSCLKRSGHE